MEIRAKAKVTKDNKLIADVPSAILTNNESDFQKYSSLIKVVPLKKFSQALS